jgi:isoleucyl-tRNA synthetase
MGEKISGMKELSEFETPPIIDDIEYIMGNNLVDLQYQSFFNISSEEEKKKSFKIVAGDFVTTDSGTGIVHIAPAFGEDDMRVAQENDLPILMTVDEAGKIAVDVPGKDIPVKKKNDKNHYAVDDLIIEDLKERNLFFAEEVYEHEYPFCWRCDTPLIYYAKPSWFIRMSSLSDELVKNNEDINWVPEHIKEGRFGEWLKGVKDWAISRDRFWGTPLPIWNCDKCESKKVIESLDKLEKLSGEKLEDVHKPFIDDIHWSCDCGGIMTRTPEVLDVWFDSGAMPLAQFHYPNGSTSEEKTAIENGKYFPADYISEAIDQTRGWFYTLHAIATLLQKAGVVKEGRAYKNVVCLAHIMDAQGKKMSKSRGNVLDPFELMDEFGADSVRWMLFTMNQPGMPKRFDIKGMRDVQNRVFRMLWNSYSFFAMYAQLEDWKPVSNDPRSFAKGRDGEGLNEELNILDRWIVSDFHDLLRVVTEKLDSYDIYAAGQAIEMFIDNLSNWYIRLSRSRFWKNEDIEDKESAYNTLYYVLVELSKLMAPFTPFIVEEMYRNLTNQSSVHLASYPNGGVIDDQLIIEMQTVRAIVSQGLKERADAKIKVRQPLRRIQVKESIRDEFLEIIQKELNVKEVFVEKNLDSFVVLDTTITPELKLEGDAREVVRFIQELRKEAKYDVDNRIEVWYKGGKEIFEVHGEMIAREVLAIRHESASSDPESFDISKTLTIDDEPVTLWLRKV